MCIFFMCFLHIFLIWNLQNLTHFLILVLTQLWVTKTIFKKSFMPYVVREWDKLRTEIRKSPYLLCSCSLEPQTTSHYLLCCHNFSSARSTLMNGLNPMDPSISQLNETALANVLLNGESKRSTSPNSRDLLPPPPDRVIIMCLNIKWVEIDDIDTLFDPCYLYCHRRSNFL